jgi:hypothetical protein
VDYIIAPENLRPYLISAVERGIEKEIRRLEEEGLSSEASGPREVVAA